MGKPLSPTQTLIRCSLNSTIPLKPTPPLMDFSSPPPTALFLNRLQGCASLNHICLTCRRESLIQPEPICYQKVPWLDYYMDPNLGRGSAAREPGRVLFQGSPSTQEDRGFVPQPGSLKVLIPSCRRLKMLSAHLWGNQSSSESSLFFRGRLHKQGALFFYLFSSWTRAIFSS